MLEQSGFTTRAVVHRNDGTARFALLASTDVLQDASWVSVADFNRDGRVDLVVSGGALLGLFVGHGDGTFSLESRYVYGRDVGPLTSGDFDADGNSDVAMGGVSGRVLVCRGLGDGSLAQPWIDSRGTDAVTWMGSMDATRDGRPDLFVVRQVANRIELLAGRGDATFAEVSRCETGLGPFGATVTDLDRDGRLDAVVCNSAVRSIAVIRDQGHGWGRDVTVQVAPGPTALAAGDLDRNGTPDLVTLHPESGDLAVCLGRGQEGFAPAQVLHVGGTPYGLALADVDGDGRTDAVLADPTSSGLHVLHGDGDGGFGTRREVHADGHPETVLVADVDADGIADLLASEPGGAEQPLHFVSVVRGLGGGAFAAARVFELPSGAASLAVADVNADGVADVVAACPQADVVAFLLGNGDGTLRPARTQSVGIRPASVVVADVDSDGQPEILVAHVGFRGLTLLHYTPHGAVVSATLATDGDARSVSVKDLDRDGWPDIIAIRAITGQLLVFPGGPGSFSSRLDLGSGNALQVIAADANGDALADLLYPDAAANAVVVLRNASFTTPVVITDWRLVRDGTAVLLEWGIRGDPVASVGTAQVERATAPDGPWDAAGPELAPQADMHYRLENQTAATWFRIQLTLQSGASITTTPLYAAAAAGTGTWLRTTFEAPDGTLRIGFEIERAAPVQWAIFDVRGRCVWRRNEPVAAGVHELVWSRTGAAGERVRRGVYWVRMVTGGVLRTRRVVLQHS